MRINSLNNNFGFGKKIFNPSKATKNLEKGYVDMARYAGIKCDDTFQLATKAKQNKSGITSLEDALKRCGTKIKD